MKYRITQIKTNIDVPMSELPSYVAKAVGIKPAEITGHEVRRKSIDSRKKPHVQYVYTVDFDVSSKVNSKLNARLGKLKNLSLIDESERSDSTASTAKVRVSPLAGVEIPSTRPVVVGMGPCGLFAGLELAKQGLRPIIIERGSAMAERIEAVEEFRRNRILNPESNMLIFEGGAGTFSVGSFGSGFMDSLIRDVLREFSDAGAGEDIMYLAKPHIGTDVLREVIVNIRKKIERLGGEIRFNTKLESFIIDRRHEKLLGIRVSSEKGSYAIDTDALILAIGHSARDTFKELRDTGFNMEPKPFSIGVRMEHPQAMIDASQYGEENVGKLPPADYKLAYKASNGRGVYSFCMCPGGEVVTCTTREGELCVNGMSNRRRDSGTANSGILCDVRISDFDSDDVLAGVRFQEQYERLAYINGCKGGKPDYTPPSCRMGDFLEDQDDMNEEALGVINSLPGFVADALREAVPHFGRIIEGYDNPDAVVTAVETRSSSPIRILRNERGVSNIEGVYPAGEGAGYAGGITSAACDGIRAAWHIMACQGLISVDIM